MTPSGKLLSAWSESETVRESVFYRFDFHSILRVDLNLLKASEMKNIDFAEEKSSIPNSEILESEDTISFQTEIPRQIQQAMKVYIEKHPNWDQYRLLQAALAGFLIQNGISSRLITRLYIGNMFGSHSF